MANRTSYVGTAVANELITAANHKKLPGGWIGDQAVTVPPVAGATTEADIALFTVTVTAGTNRRLKISVFLTCLRSVADGASAYFIKEGTTYLQTMYCSPKTAGVGEAVSGFCTVTPSAGSHTYKVSMQNVTGTGTTNIGASATAPAWIVVEDIGPSS